MIIDYSDRAMQGAIAGLGAGIVAETASFISGALNLTQVRYVDYAAILLLGHEPKTVPQTIVSLLLATLFAVMVGILFAYVLQIIGSTNLFFKSWIFSVAVWYSWYSLLTMTLSEKIREISYATAISNFVVATIYGILLGIFLRWLRVRFSND